MTIFARRQGPLDEARRAVMGARREYEGQEVKAISVDLGDATEVRLEKREKKERKKILPHP